MDFSEIKNFVLAKKQYFIAGIIVLGIFIWAKHGSNQEVDNSDTFTPSTMAKNSSPNAAGNIEQANEQKAQQVKSTTNVTCDFSGAVKNEGVYTLKNGARLEELIGAAGGLADNAQLKSVNRALILKDQDKVHIPYKGEKITANEIVISASGSPSAVSDDTSTEGQGNAASESASPKINLNTATTADLQKLNGIGEKKAQQIIDYRQKSGQFKKIEDLKQVSGIGDKTFEALKDQLAV